MKHRWFSVATLLFAAVSLFLLNHHDVLAGPPDTGRRLVLVASSQLEDVTLTSVEIRKLFLGLPVESNRQQLVPLRNQTDAVLYEVFLQKVMFMSAPMYERTLLNRLLRSKGVRPQVFDNEKGLLQALLADPHAVTFMWAQQAESISQLLIIAELWHE